MASKLRKKLTEAEKVAKEATTSVGILDTQKEELEMKIKQLENEKHDLEKENASLEAEKQVIHLICVILIEKNKGLIHVN